MKKIILTFVFAMLVCSVKAEKSVYVTKMKETIAEFGKSKTAADFKNVANSFERIAKMEQDEWLPLYYMADIYTVLIYIDSTATSEQKDQYLDKAEGYLNKLEEMAPNEAEVQVMKAFMIISRISLDPQTRGASMYTGYESALGKAKELEPNNPRVRFMILSKDVGQAQWFGQSIESYCPKLQALHDEWDDYKVASEIHPVWGKDQLEKLMESCN